MTALEAVLDKPNSANAEMIRALAGVCDAAGVGIKEDDEEESY